MATIEVTVYWTKETDTVANSREETFKVILPTHGAASDKDNLIMSFPLPANYEFKNSSCLHHVCSLPGAYKDTPSDIDLLNTAKAVLTEKYAAQAAAEKQQREEQQAAVLAEIQRILASNEPFSTSDSICYETYTGNGYSQITTKSAPYDLIIADDLYAAFEQKIKEHNKTAKAAHEKKVAEYTAMQAAKEQEKQAQINLAKKEWIEKHGSETLRLQVELGYNTDDRFFSEKLKFDFADFIVTQRYQRGSPKNNPPYWALHAEKAIRAQLDKLGLSSDTCILCTYENDNNREWHVRVDNYSPLPKLVSSKTIYFRIAEKNNK